MMITWKHKDSDIPGPWSVDTKVEIFTERCLGWQLHIADLMANGGTHLNGTSVPALPDSGFAVLQVCLSYFETIGKYEAGYAGDFESKKHFKQGVKSVFPTLFAMLPHGPTRLMDHLYAGARCGLYHASMTNPGIVVDPNAPEAITYDTAKKRIVLNPRKLPGALKTHLNDYKQKLSDPAQATLRRNFQARFDSDNGVTDKSSFGTLLEGDNFISGNKPPVPVTVAAALSANGASKATADGGSPVVLQSGVASPVAGTNPLGVLPTKGG